MKYLWVTAALVVGLAALAAGVTFRCVRGDAHAVARHDDDSLMWLRHEFALSAEQIAKIEKLHADYHQVCEGHCEAIIDARAEVADLRRAGAAPADLEAAKAKALALDAECRKSVRAHVRTIADVIGGAQGERYLSIVLSNLERFDHQGPLDLKLDSSAAHDGHASH